MLHSSVDGSIRIATHGGGVLKKPTPYCIAALLKNSPGDIFGKPFYGVFCLTFSSTVRISGFYVFPSPFNVQKYAESHTKHSVVTYILQEKEVERMPRKKQTNSKDTQKKMRPALTPEARENQLISLAVDLAEKQLIEGTASSQVITHYLKLGSTKEKIEREILEKQKELIEAKTENLQSAKRIEELYTNAINAMKNYSGQNNEEDEDDDEYRD